MKGKKMDFNVKETTEKIIEDIKNYYQKNNAQGAVIGLSGGKDSAVVASLLVKALGRENVIGFWLPCHSRESDKKDALEVANNLKIKIIEHDLTNIYDKIINDIRKNMLVDDKNLLFNANLNLKPRLRINILYYYAAYFTSLKKKLYLVCGTSNKSELYVGYFTKGGDNVCDIAPIKQLYVDEVVAVGDYLGMIPKRIIHKTPDDGLSNKSDEEKLGFSYEDVKKVSLEEEMNIIDDSLDNETREKILLMHQKNEHKFKVPTFRR